MVAKTPMLQQGPTQILGKNNAEWFQGALNSFPSGDSKYNFSHNHGSEKWIPPILVSFQMHPFYTSMIVGESVNSRIKRT